MNDQILEFLRAVGPAAIGGGVTWFGLRVSGRKNKTDVAQQIIDQLQEEVARADRKVTDAVAQVDARAAQVRAELQDQQARAWTRIESLEARERLLLDYVSRLRWHIDQGQQPPPPPWPEELGPARG